VTQFIDHWRSTRGLTASAAIVLIALSLGAARPAVSQPAPPDDIAARYGSKPRLMFTAVPIGDVERSTKFYREVTGAVIKRERRRTGFAEIFMGYSDDPKLAPTIMLVWRGGPPDADQRRASLAFETVDAAAAAEKARTAGGRVLSGPTRTQGSPVIIALVQDPDGNQVELVQYAPTGNSP
jgi:lactoylglutathione lyase